MEGLKLRAYTFHPKLVDAVGWEASCILQEVHYESERAGVATFTLGELRDKRFPMISERTVRRLVRSLLDEGFLEKSEDPHLPAYRVNYARTEVLASLDDQVPAILDGQVEEVPATVDGAAKMAGAPEETESLVGVEDSEVLAKMAGGQVSAECTSLSIDKGTIKPEGVSKENDLVQGGVSSSRALDSEGVDKDADQKKEKKESYSWADYEFDSETWAKITEGELPKHQNHNTILIGAYLLGTHIKYDDDEVVMASEFSGKLGASVRECVKYFTQLKGGDKDEGFKEALKYVKWYVTTDDDWVEESGRALNKCFSRAYYRDQYKAAKRKRKKSKKDWRKGSLANAEGVGVIYGGEEARRKAIKSGRGVIL